MNPQSGFVETGGARLYYETAGDGFPLILIHGFSLDCHLWDDQFETFSRAARAIRYDLRGFGQSSLPGDQPYRHTDDLKALMDHLGIARADLLGLSLGGAIALDFALAQPAMTRSLIVLDSVLNGFDWSEENKARDKAVFQKARDEGIEAGKRAWLAHALFAPLMRHPGPAARFREMMAVYSGWHFINRNPLIFEDPPAARRLADIAAPTLILVGELDLPDFRRIADTLEQGISGAQKRVLPGVGHLPNMEAPDEVNRVVLGFLSNLS